MVHGIRDLCLYTYAPARISNAVIDMAPIAEATSKEMEVVKMTTIAIAPGGWRSVPHDGTFDGTTSRWCWP